MAPQEGDSTYPYHLRSIFGCFSLEFLLGICSKIKREGISGSTIQEHVYKPLFFQVHPTILICLKVNYHREKESQEVLEGPKGQLFGRGGHDEAYYLC